MIYHKTTELYNNTMATLQWSTGSTELQLTTSHYQVRGNSPGFADEGSEPLSDAYVAVEMEKDSRKGTS